MFGASSELASVMECGFKQIADRCVFGVKVAAEDNSYGTFYSMRLRIHPQKERPHRRIVKIPSVNLRFLFREAVLVCSRQLCMMFMGLVEIQKFENWRKD